MLEKLLKKIVFWKKDSIESFYDFRDSCLRMRDLHRLGENSMIRIVGEALRKVHRNEVAWRWKSMPGRTLTQPQREPYNWQTSIRQKDELPCSLLWLCGSRHQKRLWWLF